MKPGKGRSSGRQPAVRRWATRSAGLLVLAGCALAGCSLLAGCATDRASVERSLLEADGAGPRRAEGVAEHYLLEWPDVLGVRMRLRPEMDGQYPIDPTGKISLGDYGHLRVEGRTLGEAVQVIAAETGQAPSDVEVRIAAYRSQYLLLSGQVIGWQRTVPYQGQETVLDLLHRIGGIAPGADLRDVYVVRTHLEESQRPEVFHVDLRAIVLKHDERTNLRLMPFDQIHVGESRPAQLERVVPPWLRPLYQVFWDILPGSGRSPPASTPQYSRWVGGDTRDLASHEAAVSPP
jgi:protein involved in polysaccharide export with SLBB domain